MLLDRKVDRVEVWCLTTRPDTVKHRNFYPSGALDCGVSGYLGRVLRATSTVFQRGRDLRSVSYGIFHMR
jgi:hypothetical protein